jgi:hypothetical protein
MARGAENPLAAAHYAVGGETAAGMHEASLFSRSGMAAVTSARIADQPQLPASTRWLACRAMRPTAASRFARDRNSPPSCVGMSQILTVTGEFADNGDCWRGQHSDLKDFITCWRNTCVGMSAQHSAAI